MNQTTGHFATTGASEAPLWAWLLVAALVVLSVVTGLLGSPYLDPIRDVYWAHRIATAREFPLVGPEIGFFTHLGPLWYYLLAPALWLDSSLTSMAAWAGLLQGLQYPLALALGQRLGQWRFGLILALLLCLPSLHSFSSLSFNHFNLVPGALLGLLLAARYDRARHDGISAMLVGLCLGLLVHAHPATLAMAWLPAWLLIRDRSLIISRSALMLAGFLVPLLPLLLAAVTSGLPETPTGSVGAHIAAHWSWSAALNLPTLIWFSLVDGFRHGLVLLTQGFPLLAWPLGIMAVATLLLSLAGLKGAWHCPGLRWMLTVALIGVLAQALAALLMRNEVLWYMMLVVPTLSITIAAAGLSQLPVRWSVLPAMVVGVIFSLALLGSMLATADDNGRRHFPAAFMMNLMAGGTAGTSHAGPQLSFHGSDRLARWICTLPVDTRLHGALAQQADTLTDLVFDLYCPDHGGSIQIGGTDGRGPRYFALSPSLAETLPPSPVHRLEALHFFTLAQVHYPPSGVALASAADYPPRERSLADGEVRSLTFQTEARSWLIVSNPFPWWAEMQIIEVHANGYPLDALAADTVSRIFHCASCPGSEAITWQLRYRSPHALKPDVVSMAGHY